MSDVDVTDRVLERQFDYDGEASRFAIYSIVPLSGQGPSPTILNASDRHRLAETSLEGIGRCIEVLRDEGDLTDNSRVGIFDRLERSWLVNPWARGELR